MTDVTTQPIESVLMEAQRIIYGDREKTYGRPDINLFRIALLWDAYLKGKYGTEQFTMTSEDVCWMMNLMKCARQMNESKRDNLVDACGYISLIERIEHARGC